MDPLEVIFAPWGFKNDLVWDSKYLPGVEHLFVPPIMVALGFLLIGARDLSSEGLGALEIRVPWGGPSKALKQSEAKHGRKSVSARPRFLKQSQGSSSIKAKQSKIKQTKANWSEAKQRNVKSSKIKQSKVKQSKVKQSTAKQSKEKQNEAKQSKVKQSKPKQSEAQPS